MFIHEDGLVHHEAALLDVQSDESFPLETVLETYNTLDPVAKREYDRLHSFSVDDWPKLAEISEDARQKSSIFRANAMDNMVFKIVSRLSHSYFPNACFSVQDPDTLVVWTSRDINTGQEVKIGYLDNAFQPPFQPRHERLAMLKDSSCFDCAYEACRSNTKEAEVLKIARRWQQLANMADEPHNHDPAFGLWISNRIKRVEELKELLENGEFFGDELRSW